MICQLSAIRLHNGVGFHRKLYEYRPRFSEHGRLCCWGGSGVLMFVQLLVVVHIWETINEDNKGGVNDVYFACLALKADAGLLIVPIDGAYFIVAILPEPERVEETETKPFGMGTHDVYTEVREVAVHKGDVRVIAFNAENADSLVLFAILAHEAA